MKSIVLFTAAAAGVLVLADRVAGTMWALPFAAGAVWLVFSLDRLHVWRERRRMRRRFHTVKDSSGQVVAWYPRHKDRPAEVIGRERKRSRVYRTRHPRRAA